MEQLSSASARIYALDALRVIMMLLGIVLHAGLSYSSMDYSQFWPIKDKQNSIGFDLIVALIHFFRMPVFFVVSGYFSASLYYRKGGTQLLINRAKRILLPFIGGVLLIYPLAVFAFEYTKGVVVGETSPFDYALTFILTGQFLPFNVLHLWFLYFLIFFVLGGWGIARIFSRSTVFTTKALELVALMLRNIWLRHISLAVIFFACLYWIGEASLPTNNDWKINAPVFITYFLFFEIGWVIYRTDTLNALAKFPARQLGSAMLLFLIFIIAPLPEAAWTLLVRQFLVAMMVSLFVFGFIALFMKYFNRYSYRLSYVMDAAYWVYLIHLPVVALLPGMLAAFELPAFAKFLIVLISTMLICLLTYHFMVRYTLLGAFLNGGVRKKKSSK